MERYYKKKYSVIFIILIIISCLLGVYVNYVITKYIANSEAFNNIKLTLEVN